MSITLAQNSTFSFKGTAYTVTSVSVEAPTPEVVNVTAKDAAVGAVVLVPTGAFASPGSIAVDCLGASDPNGLVGQIGEAKFVAKGLTVTKTAVCNSASVDARTGDLLRVRFTLTVTDYSGS